VHRAHEVVVTGFDITSILDFQPPGTVCPACRGLSRTLQWDRESRSHSCAVCKVVFVRDEDPRLGEKSIHEHFRDSGWIVDHRDLFAHATALAKVVRRAHGDKYLEQWPTMRTFFEVISRARYFVHFTSWGISHVMIGALKMTSMRVPVFGFVSDVPQHVRTELTEFPSEAPKLTAKVIPSSQGVYDAPHQKILIIDGLVAFKGSTNLTNAGARRADRQLDVTEVVTDFQQVTKLNNRYFAPVWRSLTAPAETFVWSSMPF
jgi:hypothetical protein